MPSISLPAATLAAGAIGGAASIGSGLANAGAINNATKAQLTANNQALGLQKSIFDQTQSNLSPYMQAGNGALNQELALLGLGGASQPNYAAYVQGNPDLLTAYQANPNGMGMSDWGQQHWQQYGQGEGRQVTPFSGSGASGDPSQMQASAIDALKTNPLYLAENQVGDQAILANASATGGLRSGNTNYDLANLHAQTLANVYQQMLGNLSGVSGLGASAAAGVGQLGQNFANSSSNILGNNGAASAGGILGSSGALTGGINNGLSSALNGLTLSKLLGQSGGINVNPIGSITQPGYNIPGSPGGTQMTTTDLQGIVF